MRVHLSQLTEGSVLLRDVLGKSGRPIMKSKTVLTQEHITVLHKFLIDSVEISSKQMDGKIFVPAKEAKVEEKPRAKVKKLKVNPQETRSFPAHYLEVVNEYKQSFAEWNNGVPIDIAKVRETVIPLLEQIEELEMEVFMLHRFAKAEDYIYHHAVAMSLISAFLAKELGYRKGEWVQAGLAGYLCDVGMTRIDAKIISHGGPLTEEQVKDIKNHPTYSYRMVESLTGLSQAAKIAILQHHERMDGSGYPLGLSKEKVSPFARILAISDTFHAMTSERLYKDKQSIFKVIQEIEHEQFSKFDPIIVRKLIDGLTRRAVGKTVILTNDKIGEIVFFDEDHPTKPLVKMRDNGEIISLQMNPELQVNEIILD